MLLKEFSAAEIKDASNSFGDLKTLVLDYIYIIFVEKRYLQIAGKTNIDKCCRF
jgi:hypothetical protein